MSVGLSLLPGVPQAPPAAADPKPKADQKLVAERPDRVSAIVTARQQKSRVEITGERTETSSTWANPDGTLTTEVFSGPVRTRDAAGQLVPIDLNLVADGQVLRPKAGLAQVEISATGGKGPFATVEQDGRSLSVSWPSELAKPEIKDNTATFKDAVPGGDLVVRALKSGLRYDLVLHQKPTGPLKLRLPLKAKDVKLAKAKHGGLTAADDKGRRIGAGPTPRMWDASAGASPLSPAVEGRRSKVATSIENDRDGQVLVLEPDAKFLNDPATKYPVTVDPTLNLAPVADAAVNSAEPTMNYGSAPTMDVGSWTDQPWRGFLKFDASALTGTKILSAKLNMQNVYAKQCADTGAGVQVRRVTSDWSASTVTWDTQPTTTDAAAAVSHDSHGFDASCPAGVMPFDATAIAQAWADGQANHGLALQAVPETDPSGFRVFTSSENTTPPSLQVTYNTAPATPSSAGLTPYKAWNGTSYSGISPTLFAQATDPEGSDVRLDFEVAKADGTVLWSGSSKYVASGQKASVDLPQSTLSADLLWKWRVRAYDGNAFSAWSSYTNHQVDGEVPNAPTVWCEYEHGVWNSLMSGDVRCTVDTSSDDGEGYIWSIDDPLPRYDVEIAGGGLEGEFNITPKDGWHAVYAQTHDGLGNRSAITVYHFGIGTGGLVSPLDDDRTQQFAPLASSARPTITGVTYHYRPAHHDETTWGEIPVGDITVPGTGTTLSSWPFVRTDTSKDFTQLDWDVTKSLGHWGKGDGPVEVKACFSNSSGSQGCTAPNTITVERTSFGASHAVTDIGPGRLALHTGDFSLTQKDVDVAGLLVERGHTTLDPGRISSGPFGPGWEASFPDAFGGVAGLKFEDHSADHYVQLIGSDGATSTYVRQADDKYYGVGGAQDTGFIVKNSTTRFTHTSAANVKTIFTVVNGKWSAESVDAPGDELEQSFHHDVQGRVVKILGPVPRGVTCTTSTINAGCTALTLTYAASTTATGVGSGWGHIAGQISKIDYTAYDPATSGMRTVTVASYLYDSTGRLRQTWDPRISPALTTTNYYNSHGRISQVTAAGLAPVEFDYDTTHHRLAHVTSTDSQGRAVTRAVVYDIPITGASAPVNLSAAVTATWGQVKDLPVEGSAVFPASHVPFRHTDGGYRPTSGEWKYGRLFYQDVNGRTVNNAQYGAGAWQVATARYNSAGDVIWALSAENRAQALAPTSATDPYVVGRNTTAERAELLAETKEFGSNGEVLAENGPTHRVLLESGTTVSARTRTTYAYNEGRPAAGLSMLVTTTKRFPDVVDGTTVPAAADTRTLKTGYTPVVSTDPSGWELDAPTTETTVVPNGTDIVERTRYDSDGRVIETRLPASNGADAATTLHYYYTAGTHPQVAACGLKPQWAGRLCQTAPKAQPTGQPLAATTLTYSFYGQQVKASASAGGTTRTSLATYDEAGRPTGNSLKVTPAAAGGLPVPDTTITYDPLTGLQTTSTAGDKSLSVTYDSFGRATTYTDASGNTSTKTYTVDGQVATLDDGKGTYTYTYDGNDSLGLEERRGLTTKIEISGLGTIQAAYNADGNITGEWFATSQIWAGHVYDNTGTEVERGYGRGQAWLWFSSGKSAHGQRIWDSGPIGSHQYKYDPAGRLVTVHDIRPSGCTVRTYLFDLNTNRTSTSSHAPATDGSCTTANTPITKNSSYDRADRSNDPGYNYDTLSRTVSIPASDVAGGSTLNIGYYANDMVASLTQGTESREFTLDPAGQILTMTRSGASGVLTNHYSGSGDSPAWITESDGSWTRNISGFTGMAAIQSSDGTISLQLSNLHGDVVASMANSATVGLDGYWEQTEYGAPRQDNTTNPDRYGWLGNFERSSDALGGNILMGARLYQPVTGRFLSMDPVVGGNANAYEYCAGDPINCTDLDGREKIGDGESWACIWRWGYKNCRSAYNLAVYVRAHIKRVFGHNKDNGKANAHQHALWHVVMTVSFGWEFAKWIGDNHEKHGTSHGARSDMDKFNNNLGVQFGRKLKRNRVLEKDIPYYYGRMKNANLPYKCAMKTTYGWYTYSCK